MSCGNTKKASILLVRKLYTLMQNLGPLPDSVCLNMKLAYYDDGNTHKHTHKPTIVINCTPLFEKNVNILTNLKHLLYLKKIFAQNSDLNV